MASSIRTTWNFFMVRLLKMDKQGMTRRSADLPKAPKVPGRAAEPKSGPVARVARDLQLGRAKSASVARTALGQHRADEPERRVRLEEAGVECRAAEPEPRDRRLDLLGASARRRRCAARRCRGTRRPCRRSRRSGRSATSTPPRSSRWPGCSSRPAGCRSACGSRGSARPARTSRPRRRRSCASNQCDEQLTVTGALESDGAAGEHAVELGLPRVQRLDAVPAQVRGVPRLELALAAAAARRRPRPVSM